jgi:hypothetical protein
VFEPIRGSAFDVAGKGVANPVATLWTGAMMLEHPGEKAAAARLMRAVERVSADPALHTPDLGGSATTGQVTDAAGDDPARPITFIVPHAADGPTDTVARLVAASMTRTPGQQVLVENVGDAGSSLRTARAARAEPDGYTLFLSHVAQATSATPYRKLSYDPTALEDVGLITDVPMTVVARARLAPDTIGELLDHIRAGRRGLTYGHAGVGSASGDRRRDRGRPPGGPEG